ncbi:MAG: hypothetical protein ACTSQO_13485 [Candidatus Helarchaeota archaeon]
MNLDRKKLLKSKVLVDLLKLNFPALISILLRDYDNKTVRQVLKNIGSDMAESWLQYFRPKGYNVKLILKVNTKKTFGKLKMQVKKHDDGFSLIFYECPLCRRDIEIKSEVPYCISISGFYERYFNILASENDKFGFKKIEGTTIKSISGGNNYCEHYFKIIEKY